MKRVKKILFVLLLSFGMILSSCKEKETKTVSDIFIENQSNPKKYGEPQKFTFDVDLKIDLDKELPENKYCKTVKEAMELGDEKCRELDQIRQNREKRDQITRAYENISKTLVPLTYIEKINPIAVYKINGNNITLETGTLTEDQQRNAKNAFEHFTKLIPENWRKNIVEYNIEDDKEHPFAAYITYSEKDKNKLIIGVNLDFIQYVDATILDYTFIHEFGHAFSMDETQRIKEESDDDDYLAVFKDDSYLKKFSATFWKNIPQYWQYNNRKKQEDVDEFCRINRDNFISTYAVSNVYEDFAESFTAFVLEINPLSSQKAVDKKLNFFYQYPELVLLRLVILNTVVEDYNSLKR